MAHRLSRYTKNLLETFEILMAKARLEILHDLLDPVSICVFNLERGGRKATD